MTTGWLLEGLSVGVVELLMGSPFNPPFPFPVALPVSRLLIGHFHYDRLGVPVPPTESSGWEGSIWNAEPTMAAGDTTT